MDERLECAMIDLDLGPPVDHLLLTRLVRRYQISGRIFMSSTEMARLSQVSKPTMGRALARLCYRGFLTRLPAEGCSGEDGNGGSRHAYLINREEILAAPKIEGMDR